MRNSGLRPLCAMPLAAGGLSRFACLRAHSAGIDLAPLLVRAGVTRREIEDRSARIPVQSQIILLELIADALQDDFLGFHLARDFDLREIGLLYYVLASSEQIGEALLRAQRYSTIANEGFALRIRDGQEFGIILDYVGVDRRADRHQIEFLLTTMVRLGWHLANYRAPPQRVQVMHHRDAAPEMSAFLGCEIVFDANVDEIIFQKAMTQAPIAGADPRLGELLVDYCESALGHRRADRRTLRTDVEKAIAPLLPHGKADLGEIARRLGMGKRTLVRRLASEGLTFTEILVEMKTDLARRYLRDEALSISQIAWLLGYEEISAFTHAFKRWTGQTPKQVRTPRPSAPRRSSANRGTRRS